MQTFTAEEKNLIRDALTDDCYTTQSVTPLVDSILRKLDAMPSRYVKIAPFRVSDILEHYELERERVRALGSVRFGQVDMLIATIQNLNKLTETLDPTAAWLRNLMAFIADLPLELQTTVTLWREFRGGA